MFFYNLIQGINPFLSNFHLKKEVISVAYNNPLIGKSLTDELEKNNKERDVYSYDCHNLPICMSYGEHFFACLAGAFANTRCSRGEKMQIRILNDMNPNAIHKPDKPSIKEIKEYTMG
jgi:hypothetical protein